MGELYDY
ncbi:hypothetical protein CGLO_14808 [Colletotrichum gloeosporioides Cg-14]|nr:hypothetical protein CGLO_14808 [Colletotrichum gloeosporioides Cg-14]